MLVASYAMVEHSVVQLGCCLVEEMVVLKVETTVVLSAFV